MDGSTATPDPPAALYDAIAPIYDAWQSHGGRVPFARIVAAKLLPLLDREARGGAPSYLDLGCGTGMLLGALGRARPRWRLAGVDGSAGMLAIAADRPGAAAVTWTRAALDAPLPPLGDPFAAIGCFYDTLNHLPDTDALARAFTAAAGVLRPGGLLVFDVTNQTGFEQWWDYGMSFARRGIELDIAMSYDADARAGRADVTVTRGSSTARFAIAERLFDDAEVRRALAIAGFSVEVSAAWSPVEGEVHGKTWFECRNRH